MRYTYAGMLDDQVRRYPGIADDLVNSDKFLNEFLLQSFYLGRPLAINDVYLMLNPALQRAILDQDSFFWALARHGYIAVLRRTTDSLSLLIDWAKDAGVTSLATLKRNEPRWEALSMTLDQLEATLKCPARTTGSLESGILRWPTRDTSVTYTRTLVALFEGQCFPLDLISPFEYESIKRRFLAYAQLAPEERPLPPRTYFELIVRKEFRQDDTIDRPMHHPVARRFMEVANCAYHFNFSATFEADGLLMDVCTPAEPTSIAFAMERDPVPPLTRQIPTVQIPSDLFKADPTIVRDFLSNEGLLASKRSYLNCVDHFLSFRNNASELSDRAADYSRQLARFRKPDACKYLTVRTFVRVFQGTLSSVLPWPTDSFALQAKAVTAVISAFGEPVINRILRTATARRSHAQILEHGSPRKLARQLHVRPAGELYQSLIRSISDEVNRNFLNP